MEGDPRLPTDVLPGTVAKVIVMAERAAAGLPVFHSQDRRIGESLSEFYNRILGLDYGTNWEAEERQGKEGKAKSPRVDQQVVGGNGWKPLGRQRKKRRSKRQRTG